jgi:hypothetical protein
MRERNSKMFNLFKMLLKGYEGKTFFLFLETVEGISMEQTVIEANIEFLEDENGTRVLLSNAESNDEFDERVVITINEDNVESISPSISNDKEKENGSLGGLVILYKTGTELCVEIYENIE